MFCISGLCLISIIAFVLILGLRRSASAAEPEVEPLWPDDAPGMEGVEDTEEVVDRGEGKLDRSHSNVTRPELTVHLPPKEKAAGTAVVICPGGGYRRIVIDKEGHDVAEWLNALGVAGIVLKYRTRPHGEDETYGVPLKDAQRAIRTVRSRAGEWNIDPDRIGIIGFSAGGHLASVAGTVFDGGRADATDPIDRMSCRPDFTILVYPVTPDSEVLRVTPQAAPAFLIHASDDKGVPPENSIRFYCALREADVPAELHIYQAGGHAFGLGVRGGTVASWPERCADWMRDLDLLD